MHKAVCPKPSLLEEHDGCHCCSSAPTHPFPLSRQPQLLFTAMTGGGGGGGGLLAVFDEVYSYLTRL